MAGCIAVTSAETGRYADFSASIARLRRPEGTNVYFATGSDREQGRNALVVQMLDAGDEWLLFLDDDQIFEEDLLLRLLSHEVAVVGGLYVRRDMPFTPLAYSERLENGSFLPIDLTKHPHNTLIEVVAVGTGGMLIHREVFESMEPPWFKRGVLTEDLIFCSEISESFKIYCDLGTRLGHMTTAAVWPQTVNEEWAIGFQVAGSLNFYRPLKDAPAKTDHAQSD